MEKFKNKFRIPSACAQWRDYGNNAANFITICTKNMIHNFGEIAESCWLDIPNHFPYAQLDSFVIMPNNIHGINIINKLDSDFKNSPNLSEKQGLSDSLEVGGFSGSNNPMLNDNIPRIIRWFKGRCTFEIRKIQFDFKWQTRYYDRIIRNEQEYERIKFYIENNVNTWKGDK